MSVPLTFQVPGSLAETLAAYEERRRSTSSTASAQGAVVAHAEIDPRPTSIYERSLPSLHFLRWRPLFHLQAPSGWMNDPCAPGYDPATGLYHLFFQWNPKRNVYGAISWGAINWGHAISKDMVHWTVSGLSSIKPGAWYDREGCFTGCLVPTGLNRQPRQLTILYTGVSRLPLHYTLPYSQRAETLAVAQSVDGGGTWTKLKGNPIQPEPPLGISVTGWRDPFVASWPAMDKLLAREMPGLYGVISGGIRDRGPTAFLYTINPESLTEWDFLSALVDLPRNHNPSIWSGDMGINWECANFMTLRSDVDGSSRDFLIVGGEGTQKMHLDSTFTQYPQQETRFPRTERSLQWMSGRLRMEKRVDGSLAPKMEYALSGKFDNGCLYAVNSFHDPASGNRIAWGWITEEDLPQKLIDKQNWSGMLSIPREVSLAVLQGVTGALKSKLKEITSIEAEVASDETFTIRTLGIAPAESLKRLRQGTREVAVGEEHVLTPAGNCFLDVQTCRFELIATFAVSDSCSKIGLSILPQRSP